MRCLRAIARINRRIDSRLAPSTASRSETYANILSSIDFDTALHFGSGRDKRDLHSLLAPKGEVIALDPDRYGLSRHPSENRVLGDGHQLPFKQHAFDLVFAEYVFEHLPKPTLAIEEIRRVLSPGGSFVVLVPNPKHYYAKIADITPFWFHQLWFSLQGVDNPEIDRFPTHYQWGAYHDMTEVDGFELVQFESFPGPTGYTRVLPIHFAFTVFDRFMSGYPSYHVVFLAHYELSS